MNPPLTDVVIGYNVDEVITQVPIEGDIVDMVVDTLQLTKIGIISSIEGLILNEGTLPDGATSSKVGDEIVIVLSTPLTIEWNFNFWVDEVVVLELNVIPSQLG